MPYIALQLKGVSASFSVLSCAIRRSPMAADAGRSMFQDTALYVAVLMAAFAMLYGTRHIDATERHEGMVAAIAFESIVKLVAFLAVGVFVTFVHVRRLRRPLRPRRAEPRPRAGCSTSTACPATASGSR